MVCKKRVVGFRILYGLSALKARSGNFRPFPVYTNQIYQKKKGTLPVWMKTGMPIMWTEKRI